MQRDHEYSYSNFIKAGAVYITTTMSYGSFLILYGLGNWLIGAEAAKPTNPTPSDVSPNIPSSVPLTLTPSLLNPIVVSPLSLPSPQTGFMHPYNLTLLEGFKGFAVDGLTSNDYLGVSVASAGDFNGDGISDLVIGANSASATGRTAVGTVYVLFGKSSIWPVRFDLTTLDGSNGFAVEGLDEWAYLGSSVASAGDINGDGFSDLVIGAHFSDAGKAYVLFGKPNGWLASFDLNSLNGTNGFAVEGIVAGDALGSCVSSAGDLNGDGLSDLAIGARSADPSGRNYAGTAYVIFGKSSGWQAKLDLNVLDGKNGFAVDGLVVDGNLGDSLASAGDLNGDGLSDIIFAAPQAMVGYRTGLGTVYVLFGKSSGWPARVNLDTLDGNNGFFVDGLDNYDQLGTSIASVGDINGDGFNDLAIGAPFTDPGNRLDAGTVYFIFGKSSGWSVKANLSALNGINGFTVDGLTADDNFGVSVACAGDLNRDGISDIVIGAFGADPNNRPNAGIAYVIYGKPSAWSARINLSTMDTNTGFAINGLIEGGLLGRSVASAGDLNGDGISDIVIGANYAYPYGRQNAGTVYVLFGHKMSNDAPKLLINTIPYLEERQTLILNPSYLTAWDFEIDNADLLFIITDCQHGHFQQILSTQIIFNFTQAAVMNQQIQFVHDGSEYSPNCLVTVSDGLLTDGPYPFTVVTFLNNDNDVPVLLNHAFSVPESGSILLTLNDLSAYDIDSPNTTLIFQISGLQYGHFEFVANQSVTNSFQQQEIEQKAIRFVRDNSGFSPTASVVVSDGFLESPIASINIAVPGGNSTLPILTTNTLTIQEGQRLILGPSNLLVADAATSASDLIIIASDIQRGQFELSNATDVDITTFTQQQINQGEIVFVHDGNEIAPSYLVSVRTRTSSSSTNPVAATIFFSPVNDAPVLVKANMFVIKQGQIISLNANMLSATDVDSDASSLFFAISALQNGRFEGVTSPGTSITTFSQQQIQEGLIQFLHAGGDVLAQFNVSVSDGSLSTSSSAAMTFYVLKNYLVIQPNQTLILTTDNINVLSATANDQTFIRVSNLQYGRFGLVNQGGSDVTAFSLQQLIAGDIAFIKDGTDVKPIYHLQFSQQGANQFTESLNGDVLLNHAPIVKIEIGDQQAVVNQTFNFTLPENTFDDVDDDVLSVSAQLRNGSALPSWLTFQEEPITRRHLFFGTPSEFDTHEISVIAGDPYQGKVSTDFLLKVAGNLTQTIIGGESENNTTLIAGIAAGGTVLLIGAIGAGFWFRKRAQDLNTRKHHPFADYIREALKLKGLENFDSDKGKRYLAVIQKMISEFHHQGTDLTHRDEQELNDLAQQVAISARNKITTSSTCLGYSVMTIEDLDNKISAIVQDVLKMRVGDSFVINKLNDMNIEIPPREDFFNTLS